MLCYANLCNAIFTDRFCCFRVAITDSVGGYTKTLAVEDLHFWLREAIEKYISYSPFTITRKWCLEARPGMQAIKKTIPGGRLEPGRGPAPGRGPEPGPEPGAEAHLEPITVWFFENDEICKTCNETVALFVCFHARLLTAIGPLGSGSNKLDFYFPVFFQKFNFVADFLKMTKFEKVSTNHRTVRRFPAEMLDTGWPWKKKHDFWKLRAGRSLGERLPPFASLRSSAFGDVLRTACLPAAF
jgi:hypothetical protein